MSVFRGKLSGGGVFFPEVCLDEFSMGEEMSAESFPGKGEYLGHFGFFFWGGRGVILHGNNQGGCLDTHAE